MLKKIIVLLVLSMSLVTVSCDTSHNTSIQVGEILDLEKENENFIKSSLELKPYLEETYRNSEYINGYDWLYSEIESSYSELIGVELEKSITFNFSYDFDFKLSNKLLNELSKLEGNKIEYINSQESEVHYFVLDLVVYVENLDEYEDFSSVREILREDFTNDEAIHADGVLPAYGKISYHFVDASRINENIVELGYYDNLNTTFQECLDFIDISSFYFKSEANKELESKYGEPFIPYRIQYFEGKTDTGVARTPLRNTDIIFEIDLGKDMYLASIYQYLISEKMEKLIEKYSLEETIGYFPVSHSAEKTVRTNELHLDERDLLRLYDDLDLNIYYFVDNEESIDEDMLKNLILDIYKDTDDSPNINIRVHIYEADDTDKLIILKMLKEVSLSQNYVDNEHGMDKWAQKISRTRNRTDVFAYMDLFAEKMDFIYDSAIRLDSIVDMNKLKANNRFE